MGEARSIDRGSDGGPTAIKRRRVVEEGGDDVSERTVADIVATIDDPNYMCGPDVSIDVVSEACVQSSSEF